MEIKLTVTKDFTYDILENIIVTAFEGGSNYWMAFKTDELKKLKTIGVPMSESISKALWNNPEFELTIIDSEDVSDDEIGKISLNSLLKCIETNNDIHQYLDSVFKEEFDVNDTDCIMQYWALGEITYS